MPVSTAAGTCLSVSTAAPATWNTAGFGALTWTTVGELESIPEFIIEHAQANFTNLCTGKTSVLKGSENPISGDVSVGMDRDDAGQVMMTAARKSKTQVLSAKILEPNGDIVYFRAQVTKELITGGAGPNDIRKGMFGLAVQAPTGLNDDTFVVVNAT
jgi:hypothetical protein